MKLRRTSGSWDEVLTRQIVIMFDVSEAISGARALDAADLSEVRWSGVLMVWRLLLTQDDL